MTIVSQATRAIGSSVRMASRTASEIWSAILSGWPSVTDSEVKVYRLLTLRLLAGVGLGRLEDGVEDGAGHGPLVAQRHAGCRGGRAPR